MIWARSFWRRLVLSRLGTSSDVYVFITSYINDILRMVGITRPVPALDCQPGSLKARNVEYIGRRLSRTRLTSEERMIIMLQKRSTRSEDSMFAIVRHRMMLLSLAFLGILWLNDITCKRAAVIYLFYCPILHFLTQLFLELNSLGLRYIPARFSIPLSICNLKKCIAEICHLHGIFLL